MSDDLDDDRYQQVDPKLSLELVNAAHNETNLTFEVDLVNYFWRKCNAGVKISPFFLNGT